MNSQGPGEERQACLSGDPSDSSCIYLFIAVTEIYHSLCGTNKFHSMEIVKLDAVQLYKYQRSNTVVGALVL